MSNEIKVIGASIDMNEGFSNSPDVTIQIEGIMPAPEDMRGWISKTIGDKTAWWCTDESGLVMFFLQTSDMYGYGGQTINLTLPRGKIQTLKGPWSSRPGVMNGIGFPHSLDVSIRDSRNCRFSASFLLEPMKAILREYLPDIGIYRAVKCFEPTYAFGRLDEDPGINTWYANDECMWIS